MNERDRDPLVATLLVLTATTGLVDAVSVLALGHVFTANMTGNVVFLGFALAHQVEFSASRCLVSLAAFLIGATVGGRLAAAMTGHTQRRWLLTAASIECLLFLVAALMSHSYDPTLLTPRWRLDALLSLSACAMGVRNATMRRLGVQDLTTTVLTMTMTGLGADSVLAGGTNPRWVRRVLSLLAMLVGAIIGAVLVRYSGVALPLALAGLIALAATLPYVWSSGALRNVTAHQARS